MFGMTTKRWLVLLAAIAVGASIVIALVGTALEANAATRTVRKDGVVFKITHTVERGTAHCADHPNGEHHAIGAIVKKMTNDWPRLHVWSFLWPGTDWCENNQLIWKMNWTAPHGETNPVLQWDYDPGHLKRLKDDNTGLVRFRRYQGHFHYGIGPFSRHCYPEIEFVIRAGTAAQDNEDIKKMEGC